MFPQWANRPISESSTNGERSDRRTGRTYECTNGRIDMSISQPINQRTNGPEGGPFTESPLNLSMNEPPNDAVNEGPLLYYMALVIYYNIL